MNSSLSRAFARAALTCRTTPTSSFFISRPISTSLSSRFQKTCRCQVPDTVAAAVEQTHSALKDTKKPRSGKKRQTQALLPKRINPSGKLTALATAQEYDLSALQTVLYRNKLIGHASETDALNILGEAIYLPKWDNGEVFIFAEDGSVAFWNVGPEGIKRFRKEVLEAPLVEINRFSNEQDEDMEYSLSDAETSGLKDETILLSITPREEHAGRISPLPPPGEAPTDTMVQLPQVSSSLPVSEEALVSRLTFSAGLVRSCRLAIYEDMLETHLEQIVDIPSVLAKNAKLPSKRSIVSNKGQVLQIRTELNLKEANLIDLPEFLWEASTEHQDQFKRICLALDVSTRLDALNKKLDYANDLHDTLMELQSTRYSHTLEWYIIVLIGFEISLVLLREGLPPVLSIL